MPGSTNDDRPPGANLAAISLPAPTSLVVTGAAPRGVDARPIARLNRRRARRALARFLGRPIGRKPISEIETQIVHEDRRPGFPFVEVSTPEPEISRSGAQIRMVVFRIGKVMVSPVGARHAAGIARQIRTRPGDEIAAPSWLQDLDWLNPYPGRSRCSRRHDKQHRVGGDRDHASLGISSGFQWSGSAGAAGGPERSACK
jgi:hypothetical protein